MEGSLFAPGQPVVCVIPDATVPQATIHKGHIYHVKQVVRFGRIKLVELKEFPGWGYTQDHFAPVQLAPDEAIAALLEDSLCQPA